jgi:protocatechuate 3,4-dioxygenase beta subunit
MKTEKSWDDIQTHIDEAIAALPDKLREPIIYRFLEGQTQSAIARNLGISSSTVQYRLSKGIEEMRKFLKKRGVVAPSAVLVSLLGTHLAAEAAPATLTAALGKLTLAGATGAMGGTVGASATGIATLAGILVTKKVVVVIAAVVAASAIGLWQIAQKQQTGRVQQARDATRSPPQQAVALEVSTGRDAAPLLPSQLAAKPTGDQEPLRSHSGMIRGKLIDTGGNPIGNMPVTLEQLQTVDNAVSVSPQRDRARQTAETNEEGFFEFTGLAFGVTDPGTPIVNDVPYSVYAKTSRALALEYFVLPEMSKEREIILNFRAAGSIAGRVVDERGAPVSGATIYPEAQENTHSRWLYTPLCVETGNDGLFIFTHLWYGRWQFCVSAAGYAPLVTDFVEVGEENTEFVMRRGASVAGQIVEASTGSPVPGVELYLLLPSGLLRGGFARFTATSDANGAYRIDMIPESSRAWTMALKRGAAWVFAGTPPRFMVEDGRETDLLVEVVRGGAVSGRVYDVDTGQGIANVAIEASLESGRGPSGVEARTDDSGYYRLEGLGEAVYLIECGQTDGYLPLKPRDKDGLRMLSSGALLAFQPQADQRVASRFGEEIDGIDFPVTRGAVITGRVLDMEGRPVANASIIGGHEGDMRWDGGPTGQDGTFEISGFAAGPDFYVGAVRVEGFAPAAQGPFYLTDRGLQDVEFVLEPEGSISGVVVDPAGRPITRARVMASPESEWQFGHPSSYTNIEGRFRVGGLFADRYTLKVSPPVSARLERRPLTDVDVAPGEAVTGVRLVLDTAALAAVRGVVRIGGQPAINQLVAIEPSGKPIYAGLDTHTDERGAYILQGLAPGDYDVRVDATTRQNNVAVSRSMSRPITVETGRTVQVDIDFAAGNAAIEGEVTVDGQPPRSAHISAWLVGINGETEWLHASVQHDGSYRIEGLPAGPLDIEVRAQPEEMTGQLRRTASANLVNGRTVRQDFVFSGATVFGQVAGVMADEITACTLFFGKLKLPEPFSSDFLSEHADDVASSGRISADGAFQVSCVEPGTYTLVIAAGSEEAFAEGSPSLRGVSQVVHVQDQLEVYVELELP